MGLIKEVKFFDGLPEEVRQELVQIDELDERAMCDSMRGLDNMPIMGDDGEAVMRMLMGVRDVREHVFGNRRQIVSCEGEDGLEPTISLVTTAVQRNLIGIPGKTEKEDLVVYADGYALRRSLRTHRLFGGGMDVGFETGSIPHGELVTKADKTWGHPGWVSAEAALNCRIPRNQGLPELLRSFKTRLQQAARERHGS